MNGPGGAETVLKKGWNGPENININLQLSGRGKPESKRRSPPPAPVSNRLGTATSPGLGRIKCSRSCLAGWAFLFNLVIYFSVLINLPLLRKF